MGYLNMQLIKLLVAVCLTACCVADYVRCIDYNHARIGEVGRVTRRFDGQCEVHSDNSQQTERLADDCLEVISDSQQNFLYARDNLQTIGPVKAEQERRSSGRSQAAKLRQGSRLVGARHVMPGYLS